MARTRPSLRLSTRTKAESAGAAASYSSAPASSRAWLAPASRPKLTSSEAMIRFMARSSGVIGRGDLPGSCGAALGEQGAYRVFPDHYLDVVVLQRGAVEEFLHGL